MICPEKLDFWIEHRYNVLFEGKHGVGKTSIIKAAFEKADLKWKYFSAATMDPWVDFVGTPKEVKNEDGTSYLDLVRPKDFAYDQVEALFFDEFNRSAKKTRNAVMELIQFKSINGKRFENLKVIWAAINPDNENEYDVEKLDPAQKDRFHICVKIPYEPHPKYFSDKYGNLARPTLDWWNNLSKINQDLVSPRRLDYVLDIYKNGGDISDALPFSAGIVELKKILGNNGKGYIDLLSDAIKENRIVDYLKEDRNYKPVIRDVIKNDGLSKIVLPLLTPERVRVLIEENLSITEMRNFARVMGEDDRFFNLVIRLKSDSHPDDYTSKLIMRFLFTDSYRKLACTSHTNLIALANTNDLSAREATIVLDSIIEMPCSINQQASTILQFFNRFSVLRSQDFVYIESLIKQYGIGIHFYPKLEKIYKEWKNTGKSVKS